MSGTTSLTSDLGTEALLPALPKFSLKRMFPWISVVGAGQDDGFYFQGEEEVPQMMGLNVDLSSCLHIPGLLRIIDNAASALTNVMEWYSEFVHQLTHVCRLLKRKWSRE
eukprot:10211754-Lingulodinium_polyedra.AAC.1